jgi:hypothetical protein
VFVEPIPVEDPATEDSAEVEGSATSVAVEEADSIMVLETSAVTDDEITSDTTANWVH